jgi:hypothetical protein
MTRVCHLWINQAFFNQTPVDGHPNRAAMRTPNMHWRWWRMAVAGERGPGVAGSDTACIDVMSCLLFSQSAKEVTLATPLPTSPVHCLRESVLPSSHRAGKENFLTFSGLRSEKWNFVPVLIHISFIWPLVGLLHIWLAIYCAVMFVFCAEMGGACVLEREREIQCGGSLISCLLIAFAHFFYYFLLIGNSLINSRKQPLPK